MQRIRLRSGRQLPTVGLGLWKISQADTARVVRQAAEIGYRHFDSACDYGNESQAGDGLKQVIENGVCSRDDLWITSKLWNTYHRPEHVRPALEKTLRDLQLDELDLYLIHFPISQRYVPFEKRYPPGWIYDPEATHPRMEPDPVPLRDTWEAMEKLVDSGLVKEIGVCNFGTSLLRDLLSYARIPPAVLQIESHPYLTQEKLIRFCQEQDIAVTAFSPLGAQSYFELQMARTEESVMGQPCIQAIADTHRRTPAQVLLRWGVQRGTAVIPKSTRVERLRENLNIFDFSLSDQEMNAISELNRNRRFNDPGEFCEAAFGRFFPIYE